MVLDITMTLLDQILTAKYEQVKRTKRILPINRIDFGAGPPVQDFTSSVRRPGLSVIAEIKHKSPSAGILREVFDPLTIARLYQQNNADALSVVTDTPFFGGSCDLLKRVMKEIQIPLLRKDFIIDEYQIFESRAIGADAILLIVRLLKKKTLRDFLAVAKDLGMAVLVEVHSFKELMTAIDVEAQIIGINNRNLDTLEVDVNLSMKLKPFIPETCLAISESGIHHRDHIRCIRDAGFDGILVGELLLRSDDPGKLLQFIKTSLDCKG
jgi:indole-3-glycerol phosphate synthase